MNIYSRSPEQTIAVGAALASALGPGDTVCLRGDLGAGKTQLVKGLARGLGLPPNAVTSPTFVIAHVHENPRGSAPLVHVDAYRLSGLDELADLGWDRIFDGNSVVAIEWPERIDPGEIPGGAIILTLAHTGETERRITIDSARDLGSLQFPESQQSADPRPETLDP